MVRVLVSRHAPLAERKPAKRGVNRTIAVARSLPDALHQSHELRPNGVDGRRVGNQQLRRSRGAFWEWCQVQDEMLDWEHLKGPLALVGNRELAESHERRQPQV